MPNGKLNFDMMNNLWTQFLNIQYTQLNTY